ncbi:hypothetical protein C9940_04740 [Pseudidiomarina aestuarii]|uniref:Uncharacterized protein n=1 Tax=Pseudidiomarina aestuarii TaxID=624146 RepID=A0A2T4CW94_9GAMM|nr:hypothetical protein C9940_04740 [Pseudidiomarina aestuarii]
MEAINNFLLLLDSYLGSAGWFPYVLLGVGVFFTSVIFFHVLLTDIRQLVHYVNLHLFAIKS